MNILIRERERAPLVHSVQGCIGILESEPNPEQSVGITQKVPTLFMSERRFDTYYHAITQSFSILEQE